MKTGLSRLRPGLCSLLLIPLILLTGCASSQGGQSASASPTGSTKVTQVATPVVPQARTLLTYSGHSAGVVGLAWSPDGKMLASASDDSSVQIWDASTGKTFQTLKQTGYLFAVVWSPDGKEVAAGGSDKTVDIWNVATGKLLQSYQGYDGGIYGLAWSPDGKKLAIGGDAQSIPIIDPRSGKTLVAYQGQKDGARMVAWSPTGKEVASAGYGGTIQIWDAASGKTLFTFGDNKTARWSVAWSPDGKEVVSGAGNIDSAVTSEVVNAWSATDGHELPAYKGHQKSTVDWGDGVFGLAWSPNGTKLASGGADGLVLVWDGQSGRALAQSDAHRQVVWSVAWSPDGKRLASASQDRSVVIISVG